MSLERKYQICKLIFAAGFIVEAFSLIKMVQTFWFAFDPTRSKFWFVVCMNAAILTLPFALGFYYYRARIRDFQPDRAGAEALSQAGKNLAKRKHSSK